MSRRGSWAESFYRVVVSAYPRAFRERFGEDLIAGFSRMRRAESSPLRMWRLALADAVVSMPREQLRAYRLRRGVGAVELARRYVFRPAASPADGSSGGGATAGGGRRAVLGGGVSDVRVAVRSLQRSPAFTLVVVLSLAFGVGANTALFTMVNAVWFAEVPGVADPDGLVELVARERGWELDTWTYADFRDVRDAETPLASVAGWTPRTGNLEIDGARHGVRMLYVSANYFQILGVVPARGRDLPEGGVSDSGHAAVAIVSHQLWQGRLGGDPEVIGRTLTINNRPWTVIGVAPEEFIGSKPQAGAVELWLPLPQHPYLARVDSLAQNRERDWLLVFGKLGEAGGLEQAESAVQTVMARLAQQYPETNENRDARLVGFSPLHAANRNADLSAVVALVALVALVLLIICGNVAGMILARAATNERELAVRIALGSGRRRLVAYLMTEALVLAVTGGGLGTLAAFWATGAISATSLGVAIPNVSFQPDMTVLLYSVALTLLTTLLFGMLPALRASRPEIVVSLKDDSGGGGHRVGRVHTIAASAQTGLALFLLAIASLFVRSIDTMEARDVGFEPDNLLVTASRVLPTMTAGMNMSLDGYESSDRGLILIDQLADAVGSLPGVISATVADGFPLDMNGNYSWVGRGDQPAEGSERVQVEYTGITERFFETIGTPILQGRGIEATDVGASEPVVVITRTLAARLWPGEEALGRTVSFTTRDSAARSSQDVDHVVVGVVGHVGTSRIKADLPHVFVALRQAYYPRLRILVRGTADAATLGRSIQSAIVDVDPQIAIPLVVDAGLLVAYGTSSQRTFARASAGFGLLTLLLAAIGVYGVVAYAVANRRREIGIRMAVGATRQGVMRVVLRDGVRLALPGLAIGAVLAVGIATVLTFEFPNLNPVDPLALATAAGVLFLVVLIASAVPARRASGIDPMEALRSQ